MIIRPFNLSDYEDVVEMLYAMNEEVYPDRKLGYKYSYYATVKDWVDKKHNIVIAEKGNDICGFTLSYIDYNSGLTEPTYRGDIAYVKPEYRKGRAAYLLYNNVVEYAKDLKLKLVSMSRIENGVDKMVTKHFNAKPTYIMMEGN